MSKQSYPSHLVSARNLLLLSTLIVVVMVILRVFITFSIKNIYLIWNLFLASVPYFTVNYLIKKKIPILSKRFFLLLFIWLIFLPNSPYIITDLIHLQYNETIPIWYDIFKLFLAGFTGLLWGHFSLLHLIYYVESKHKIPYKRACIFMVFILASYGVYIGRFLRWNSWDIFVQPMNLLISLKSNFCLETIAFILILAGLQFITYLTLRYLIYSHHDLVFEK